MDQADPALTVKYQKLLSEFSKLKNQLIVLNKGLGEEQGRGNVLQEQLKEKERLVKQLREESESRQFRNQQLTRRVSVLQQELTQQPPSAAPADDSSTFSIFDAELTSKITQISELHQKIQHLTVENEGLRQKNQRLCRETSNEHCPVNASDELIQPHDVAIDQLNQRPELPLPDRPVNGEQTSGASDQGSVELGSGISGLKDGTEASDAKAALFSSECQRMKQRLIVANEQREGLGRELNDTKHLVQKLRDELSTSVRNYETQLETMSEHLASMNEKWSKQQIEMDSLQLNISQRKSSKTH